MNEELKAQLQAADKNLHEALNLVTTTSSVYQILVDAHVKIKGVLALVSGK